MAGSHFNDGNPWPASARTIPFPPRSSFTSVRASPKSPSTTASASEFSYEFLRVFSPSAEVRGHGVGQEVLQLGKRDVTIERIEPVGNYAIRPVFRMVTTAACIRGTTSTGSARTATICGRPTSSASRPRGGSRDPADLRRPPQGRRLRAPLTNEPPTTMNDKTTHFGFQQVAESEKAGKVRGVFSSVAGSYDVMNDLMSFGLHRLWKAFTVQIAGVRKGDRVLDVAGGTADLSLAFAKRSAHRPGVAHRHQPRDAPRPRPGRRQRPAAAGGPVRRREAALPDNHFDVVTVAFGLRNMTHKDQAIAEMRQVLKPGGRLLVLEFSKVWKPLAPAYDFIRSSCCR